jgi:hypothetical protein
MSSQFLHSLLGGLALFCLLYAAMFFSGVYLTGWKIVFGVCDYHIAKMLLLKSIIWGGLAGTIIYFQGKYLSNV